MGRTFYESHAVRPISISIKRNDDVITTGNTSKEI
ncbi:hypothetical protein M2387_000767 [Klebsiella sp. BIGb0407]|nr:hypothetical protein [Klebsiella sp. BIGb0407]